VRRRCGTISAEVPGDATALQQASNEGGVGLVVLHREFALRIFAQGEQFVGLVVEGGAEDGVGLAPFVQDPPQELDARDARDAAEQPK
jgi:hypothetical protein